MKNMTHSTSSISAISNYDASSSHQNNESDGDDSQLFFVTSYSDFDKLGKIYFQFFTKRWSCVNNLVMKSFIFSLNAICTFLSCRLLFCCSQYKMTFIQIHSIYYVYSSWAARDNGKTFTLCLQVRS